MTTPNEALELERTELIQKAYKLTGDLLSVEKTLYGLKQAQVGLAISLVQRHKLPVTEAATICGMPRQRLAQELRIRALRGDYQSTTTSAPPQHEQPFLPPASAE